MNFLRQRELALAVCVSLGLTACGGGGGGGTRATGTNYNVPPVTVNPTLPGTPPPPSVTFPYDVQISATNTAVAQAAGAKGANVTIAIVDSGVATQNPALTGRVTKSFTYVDPTVNNTAVDDVVGHGTAVAQIAAGTPVKAFAGGVAPAASIVSARIIADKAPTDDGSGSGNLVTGAGPLGQVNADVIAAGARVVNNSWGGLYWNASATSTTESFATAYSSASQGTLQVFAAGNDGKANPSDVAMLPTRLRAIDNTRGALMESGWLTVVALDSGHPDTIATYSNRCGAAQNYCLAAPGSVVALTTNSSATLPTYNVWEGTSLAAPQVTGGAAVVAGVFPSLSMQSIRQILLGTADDLGTPGPDAIYGYGRLNVGRAIGGPGKLDWNEFTVDLGDVTATPAVQGSITFSNAISGSGSIKTQGYGVLTLASQNNTYSGGTLVGAGTGIDALGTLPGNVTVEQGAALLARKDIDGSLKSGGRLQTTSTSTHINGNLTLYSTSTVSQVLGAPLIVSGTANLDGEFYIAGVTGGYVKSAHQQVLSAGLVVNQFASTTLAPGIFLATNLQYTPTEVWVDTSQISVIQVASTSMASSLAATSSAQRLDGAFNQLNQNVSSAGAVANGTLMAAGGIQQSKTTQQAQASLESLSGQLYAAGTAVTLAGIDASNDALIAHLDQQRTGGWTQSLNNQGGLSRGGFGSVGFNLNGGLAGHDIRLGLNGFAGVAVAQMASNGQLNGSFDRQRSRSTAGMFYAGSRGANWYGVGQVGFGSFRGDMRRMLQFGDQVAFAGSDQNGSYNSAYGEVGYRSQAGAFTLTPFANVQYASIHRDGFSENGGEGFGLAADGHTTSRWQAGFGLRAGSTWLTSHGTVHLDAKLGWQNAFATKGEVFAARYTGFAQWAPVDGIGLSRRAGTAGVSLGWDMSAHTQLGFNVDQRFADRDHSRSANATFRMAW
ncbi:S8 family serine peptidase [Luteibacter sp. RCC_6_2]|uniref:S8 family serine peptidase n=1 Tax=Luteibacter sp. RCC_6_2 TaxID=3239223 RepID=UPI003525C190